MVRLYLSDLYAGRRLEDEAQLSLSAPLTRWTGLFVSAQGQRRCSHAAPEKAMEVNGCYTVSVSVQNGVSIGCL